MKKLIVTVLVAVIAMTTANFGGFKPAEACELPECQNLFTSTLNELIASSHIEHAQVSYTTEKVYDMEFNELGCLYDFTVNDLSGYAVMIYYEGQFDVSEIHLDAENPYKDCPGRKIYPAPSLYLYYSDGNFYDAATDLPFSDDAVATISDIAFCGGEAPVESASQRIYYEYHTDPSFWLCAYPPDYIGISGMNNICVAIAAGNIIGFWDRYKPELIPDYEPGSLWNDMYFYDSDRGPVDDCIRQLATDMNAGSGTTVTECKNGMTTYCNRAGYTITYTNLMSGGTFGYDSAKAKFHAGDPIMIFSEGFTVYVYMPSPEEGYDSYMGITCAANHAMAGFGYMDVSYTFSDGSTSSANYIYVASGQSTISAGYYNIRTHSINDAFSVHIS